MVLRHCEVLDAKLFWVYWGAGVWVCGGSSVRGYIPPFFCRLKMDLKTLKNKVIMYFQA